MFSSLELLISDPQEIIIRRPDRRSLDGEVSNLKCGTFWILSMSRVSGWILLKHLCCVSARSCCSCFCACLFKSILRVSECNWFHDNFLNQWLKFIHHNLAIKHFTAGRLLAWLHAPGLAGVLLFSLRALSYPESVVRRNQKCMTKLSENPGIIITISLRKNVHFHPHNAHILR